MTGGSWLPRAGSKTSWIVKGNSPTWHLAVLLCSVDQNCHRLMQVTGDGELDSSQNGGCLVHMV
jgi:hypothetical protein